MDSLTLSTQLSKCLTNKHACPCCLLPACCGMLGGLEESQAWLWGEEGSWIPHAQSAQAEVLWDLVVALAQVKLLHLFAF